MTLSVDAISVEAISAYSTGNDLGESGPDELFDGTTCFDTLGDNLVAQIDFQSAPISITGSGDHTVVAASAGQRIRVHTFCIVPASAVTVTWKSGTSSPLTGAMPISALWSAPDTPRGHFITAEGESLNLYTGSNVAITGWVVYAIIS